MQNQSITLKLDLPEFIVQETITDQKGDLFFAVITDLNGRCTHEILEGRSKQTIGDFLQTLQNPWRIKIVVTDM